MLRNMLRLLTLTVLTLAATASHAAVVFMYHRFGETAYPSTSVNLDQFEAHLQHLDEAGYRVWPLERIARHLQEGRPLPDRVIGLSVDDAYRSFYLEAWPRLRARGWPVTVFVATDYVDRGSAAYMSWAQMRELAAEGVAFANHSRRHDKLHERRSGESAAQWRARVRADLEHAERRLREELGEQAVPSMPRLFAYPYGEFDSHLIALVAELGYVAFGQHSGAIGPYSDLRALPRFPMAVAYAEIADFRQKAATLALPLTAIEPADPVLTDSNNPPRLTATLGAVQGDPRRLTCFASGQGALEVQWLDENERRFSVQASRPYGPGRARYNCTLPAAERGRFYWYSQPWIVPGGHN